MLSGIFVTSNNTDSGKTFIGTKVLTAIEEITPIHPYKPIETACPIVDGVLYPRDAHALQAACQTSYDIEAICPYRFSLVASGELASSGQGISMYDLIERLPKGLVLVEGAGGFFSPLLVSTLNADFAQTLGFPVLIVIEDTLGAISEALLTISAVRSYGLPIFAVVMNNKVPNNLHNSHELAGYTEETIIEYHDQEQFKREIKRVLKVWAVAKK